MKRSGFVAVLIFFSINFCIEATPENYGLSESEGKCDHNCFSVVLETLQVAHSFHSAGQVLVSSDWFQTVDQLSLTRSLGEFIHVPWVIYAQAKNTTAAITTSSQSGISTRNRFTSARFAHLHHSTFATSTSHASSSLFINAQRQQTWRKFLYLTIRRGIRISILDLLEQSSSSSSKGAGLLTAWHTLIQKDLFIVTFDLVQLLDSVASIQKKQLQLENHVRRIGLNLPQENLKLRERRPPSKNTIWIGCSPSAPPNGTNSSRIANRHVCIYSLRKGFAALLGHISHCSSDTAVTMHIDRFHQLMGGQNAGAGENATRFNIPLVKRRGVETSSNDLEETDTPTPSSGMAMGGMLTRRRLDPLSGRKGFLYSSLVFITKKLPDNNNNGNSTSSSVWGPFTVASWLGILAAYTLTAIVFGIIKLVTLNNLENSWYDWVIGQLLGFLINVEKVTGTGTMTRLKDNQLGNGRERICSVISSSTVVGGINIEDENANEIQIKDASKFLRVTGAQDENLSKMEIRRISVKSLAADQPSCPTSEAPKEENQQATFVQVKCSQNRGKISRTILYGTIRIVSFIILGLYEGNLYTTITFPKSKLVATFDELISSDKYMIKVSSEAAKFENITARIQRGNSSAPSFGNEDTFLKSPPELPVTAANRSTSGSVGEGKFVESVNILDCVNWVETGPDPNHACVGYEFELRNLHKAQKSDKIVVRSNKRLLRFSATGGSGARLLSGRRRGFTMFPGGFQISKWILESGILQLWSVVENAFLESIVNPHWGDPFKVFTIRDYMGLFVVYAMLLVLATIMFLLEHIVRMNGKSCWMRMRCQDFCCIGNCSSCEVPSWLRIMRGSTLDKWRGRKYFQGWSAVNRTAV